jgi:hypothetical protein
VGDDTEEEARNFSCVSPLIMMFGESEKENTKNSKRVTSPSPIATAATPSGGKSTTTRASSPATIGGSMMDAFGTFLGKSSSSGRHHHDHHHPSRKAPHKSYQHLEEEEQKKKKHFGYFRTGRSSRDSKNNIQLSMTNEDHDEEFEDFPKPINPRAARIKRLQTGFLV